MIAAALMGALCGVTAYFVTTVVAVAWILSATPQNQNLGFGAVVVLFFLSFLFAGFIGAWMFGRLTPYSQGGRKHKRKIPHGHCQNCGYDLTGNVSGRCSECGMKIESP